jgi:glycosyltransferase involved in cell wall biosynthesis
VSPHEVDIAASSAADATPPSSRLAGCTETVMPPKRRVAFVVSHPIQYFVPLHQRLGQRPDLAIKVFFTWHDGRAAVEDRGFKAPVAWDIPMPAGYELELVPNRSADPGTHRFLGLRNSSLMDRVMAWRPDVVHVTGWAWLSHLQALRAFRRLGVRTLFRGDSHLLDSPQTGLRWWIKRAVLRRVYSWPNGFLVVGSANRAYCRAFGVAPDRLHACPHSIDVGRFAEPAAALDEEAMRWRKDLGISPVQTTVLFAGKFESKKRPAHLMRAVQRLGRPDIVVVLVGGGELQREIDGIAAAEPERFRVLPFQNQSRMPVVYRLGDQFVLPSADGETWGLAVNEAMACGRAVLVSDRVGCAADVVDPACGRVFEAHDPGALENALVELLANRDTLRLMGRAASARAQSFDIAVTESALVAAVEELCAA